MNCASSEKWPILGLGQEINKMSVEHIVVPKHNQTNKQATTKPHKDRRMSKRHRSQLEEFLMAKSEKM